MIRLFMLLLVIGWVVVCVVPSSHAITLDEAVATALKQNLELQALRLEEQVARAQLEKARLPLIANPVIEGAGAKKEKPAEDGSGKFTNYGIKLSQEFEIAGQRGIRIDVARKNVERVKLEVLDKERTLAYDTKEAFTRALASMKRAELAREVVRLQEELLEFAKIRYRAGAASALEVNLAEVELSKARRDLLFAARESKEALLELQGMMGFGSGDPLTLEGDLSLEPVSVPDLATLKELAGRQRPDIKAASLEVDRAKRSLDLVNREAIPNVTLGGFFDRDENRNELGATLSISIPIFDRKQAEKKEAFVKASQARIRQTMVHKTAEREIEEIHTALTTCVEELSLFKKEIMNKSLENMNLLNLAFKEGKISFFDVRVAQRETFEIQVAYLETMVRARRAMHAIEKAVGGGVK